MKNIKNEIAIYQSESGAIELRGDWQNETIWATQAQIANLFKLDRTAITKHIKNIIKFGEIDEKSNVQKMHIANSDKPVAFYSLDIILAIGYRVNSKTAIKFRRWASEVLKQHIFKGFTVNKERIASNYKLFLKALDDVKALLPESSKTNTVNILELVSIFADTWFSLNAYDAEELPKSAQFLFYQFINFFHFLRYNKYTLKQAFLYRFYDRLVRFKVGYYIFRLPLFIFISFFLSNRKTS
jgi:hypothetical protein